MTKKFEKEKPEYVLAEEIEVEYPGLICVGNVLFYHYNNQYIECEHDVERDVLRKAKNYNLSTTVINKVIKVLKIDKYIDDETYFTHEDWIVPFLNGYFDVKADRFIQIHEKNFFYNIPHNYDFKQEHNCLLFKHALKKWLKNNKKITPEDIFEIMGYCMTMNTNLKRAFFFMGEPDTGKTTFLNILRNIIGKNNGCSITLERMVKNEFGTDGMQLKIINIVGDLGSSQISNTGIFKEVVGGDEEIAVEKKGKDKSKFINHCKQIFAGNKLIPLKDYTDQAFFDRWIIVEFTTKLPRTKDPFSKFIISNPEEIQGIIHECIKGLIRLYERGNFREEIIDDITNIWRYNSDNLYRYVNDKCVLDTWESIPTKEFTDRYVLYVVLNKLGNPVSNKYITSELRNMGILFSRPFEEGKQRYMYEGIRFKTESELKPKEEVKEEMIEEFIEDKSEGISEEEYESAFEKWEEEQQREYEMYFPEEKSPEELMYKDYVKKHGEHD